MNTNFSLQFYTLVAIDLRYSNHYDLLLYLKHAFNYFVCIHLFVATNGKL